jgi:hypothetical protein
MSDFTFEERMMARAHPGRTTLTLNFATKQGPSLDSRES